jgi:hypothetical protein
MELSYDTGKALLGLSLRDKHTACCGGTHTPMLTAALFTRARSWTLPHCMSTDEWMRQCGLYMHNAALAPPKRMVWCHLQESETTNDHVEGN